MHAVKLGYVIIYVENVARTIEFYGAAFGLEQRFIHESGTYAELETGQTALAFASESAAPTGVDVLQNRPGTAAAAVEVALIVEDVEAAYKRALAAGAAAASPPESKPWGQVVAYVRDLNGFLVELCTQVSAA